MSTDMFNSLGNVLFLGIDPNGGLRKAYVLDNPTTHSENV